MLLVFVAFIGGDIDYGPHSTAITDGLKQVYRTHDIGFISFARIFIGLPDYGLGGHVNYYFRPCRQDSFLQAPCVTDIGYK